MSVSLGIFIILLGGFNNLRFYFTIVVMAAMVFFC